MVSGYPYICVHCGKPASALYREYTKDLLKICRCENCGEPVDNYIETEVSIILIDAILQRKEAYRHIIYNSESRFVWKLAFVFLLCDVYQIWVTDRTILSNIQSGSEEFVYLELEWNFYLACFKATIENVLFLFFTLLLIFITQKNKLKTKRNSMRNLLNGFITFSYGKVFFIPAVLWGMHSGTVTEFLITIFVLISVMQVCIVVMSMPRWIAVLIILASHFLHRAVSRIIYRYIHAFLR